MSNDSSTHAIQQASGAAVSEFFNVQDENDDMAVYVFDGAFTWCVCSTDRLTEDARPGAADFLTIPVGDFPGAQNETTLVQVPGRLER